MGSIFKAPSPPPVPVYEPPVPEPEVPTAEDEAREAEAKEEARRRDVKRKGRRSTILTGSAGLDEDAEISKKTLLGG